MSEYQYFEFQAIDRILTAKEMAALRQCSSRAHITPGRFVNHYNFGDFKGDVEKWMERYFDAFLYLANWGTRRLILRFPKRAIDTDLVEQYCSGQCACCWTTDSHALVEFCVHECGDGEWLEEDDESLGSLLPLRSEVSLSDYRLFYLGWLLCVQYGEVSAKETEPPVPLGLGTLTPALDAFVEFFRLDRDLLKAAATNSSWKPHDICTDDIEPCIAGLSNSEKFSWLCRLALEDTRSLQSEFRHYLLPDCGLEFFSNKPRRAVGDIIGHSKKPKKTQR